MRIKYIGPCADGVTINDVLTDDKGEIELPEDIAKGYLEQDIWVAVKGAAHKTAHAEKE